MPAGYGTQCWECDWTARAKHRIQAEQDAFDTQRMAERYGDFGTWLIRTAGPHAAALRVHRYRSLFADIEREWGDIPDYGMLLGHFGVEGLRRRRVPVRWMAETGLVVLDRDQHRDDSERRRITATFARLPKDSTARRLLDGYHRMLLARNAHGRLSLSGVRLALAPAARLLEVAHAAGEDHPSQRTLDNLLGRSPGQHAALTGLIVYLRTQCDIKLTMPPYQSGTQARQRHERARLRMQALMDEDGAAGDFAKRWRTASLTFFHDVPERTAAQVEDEDVRPDRDGLAVSLNGQDYWIPRPPASP